MNKKLYSIEFLRTEMKSGPSNSNRNYELSGEYYL